MIVLFVRKARKTRRRRNVLSMEKRNMTDYSTLKFKRIQPWQSLNGLPYQHQWLVLYNMVKLLISLLSQKMLQIGVGIEQTRI